MARLFISQGRLDAWALEERVKIDADVMTLAGDGRSFRLRTAVRFLKVSGDGADPNGLVNKVNREDLWREAAKTLSVAAEIPLTTTTGGTISTGMETRANLIRPDQYARVGMENPSRGTAAAFKVIKRPPPSPVPCRYAP